MIWRDGTTPFTVKGTYEILADKGTSKWWTELVWNSLSIPKHSFCAWLAVMNRLQTKDRMRADGVDDVWCGWCSTGLETNEHILILPMPAFLPICIYLEIMGIKNLLRMKLVTLKMRKKGKNVLTGLHEISTS
ncbi:hypothetical protein QQ045_024345 [Rhodiola kirilowii]